MQSFGEGSSIEGVTGNAPYTLLRCSEHLSIATKYRDGTLYDWCVELGCTDCAGSWFVCKLCPTSRQRSRIITVKQLKLHNTRYHQNSNSKRYSCKRTSSNTQEDASAIVMTISTQGRSSTTGEINPDNLKGYSADQAEVINSPEDFHHTDNLNDSINASVLNTGISDDCRRDGESTNEILVSPQRYISIDHDAYTSLQYNHMSASYSKSQIYYAQERSGSSGPAFLAGLSYFGHTLHTNNIPTDEVKFFFNYADLARKLGGRARSALGCLLEDYDKIKRKQQANATVSVSSIDNYPLTEKDMRNKFFEGKNSLFANYPRPQLHKTDCGHVYSLFSDILVNYLELGMPLCQPKILEPGSPKRHLFHCEIVQDHLKRHSDSISDKAFPIIDLVLCEWSDDFEPNYGSHNKGSVFLKTISIIQAEGVTDSMMYTFPVILGPKNADHRQIEKIIIDDLQQLQTNFESNLFFSSYFEKHIRVNPVMAISLQDQPARRSYTGIANGNGSYSGRWGYACNWSLVATHLPMCSNCYAAYKTASAMMPSIASWNPPVCKSCTSWAYDLLHPLLSHHVPKDYPCHESTLKPRQLSFGRLRAVINETHNRIVSGEWSIASAIVYLKTWALSDKTINEITDCADNYAIAQSVASEEDQIDEQFREHVMEEVQLHPEMYSMWEPPVSWEITGGVTGYSNTIMHLMSGICKTTVIYCLEWINKKFNSTLLTNRGNVMMKSVSALGLDWCRLPPKFGGKFVGSQSENNINIGRIAMWIFSALPPIQDSPAYIEPSSEPSKWLKKDNIAWLKSRGIAVGGTAEELKKRVAHYYNSDNPPPPLSEQCGDSIVLLRVVHSLYHVLSLCFKTECTSHTIFLARIRIRLFLQHFSKLDKEVDTDTSSIEQSMETKAATTETNSTRSEQNSHNNSTRQRKKGKRVPKWVSSYNFLSLLNIPDEMTLYGPPRCHYEGSYKGEKFVGCVKPLIEKGLYGNWAHNCLETHWANYTTRAIQEKHGNKNNVSVASRSQKMFKIYKAIPEIQFVRGMNQPISGCLVSGKGLMVAIAFGNRRDSSKLVPITLGEKTVEYCGAMYYDLQLLHDDYESLVEYNAAEIIDYCIFLPIVSDAPVIYGDNALVDQHLYTVVTNEWSPIHICNEVVNNNV